MPKLRADREPCAVSRLAVDRTRHDGFPGVAVVAAAVLREKRRRAPRDPLPPADVVMRWIVYHLPDIACALLAAAAGFPVVIAGRCRYSTSAGKPFGGHAPRRVKCYRGKAGAWTERPEGARQPRAVDPSSFRPPRRGVERSDV